MSYPARIKAEKCPRSGILFSLLNIQPHFITIPVLICFGKESNQRDVGT